MQDQRIEQGMARRGGDQEGAIQRWGRGGLCRDRCGRGRGECRVGGLQVVKQRDEAQPAVTSAFLCKPARPVWRQDGDDRK